MQTTSLYSTDWINLSWKLLVTRGALAVVLGVVALVWPDTTTLALVLIWGVWALVDGFTSIAQAFTPEGKSGRVPLVLMGVVALLAGLIAITSPGFAAATMTWVLGIWLIVRAGFELVGAFGSTREAPRWLLILGAAVSLVIGVLFMANPGRAAVTIVEVLGALALVWGVVFVVTGVAMRRELPAAGEGDRLAHT